MVKYAYDPGISMCEPCARHENAQKQAARKEKYLFFLVFAVMLAIVKFASYLTRHDGDQPGQRRRKSTASPILCRSIVTAKIKSAPSVCMAVLNNVLICLRRACKLT